MADGFEWDERKRLANLEKHGIDFGEAAAMFAGDIIEWKSNRGTETRWLTVGMIGSRYVTVISTFRSNRRRIISARRARQSERRAYSEAYPRGSSQEEG